jgi:oligosaccharide repeat unit polymerase
VSIERLLKYNKGIRDPINTASLNKYIRGFALIWTLGSALEIVFSGGLPIVWAFTGSAKDYTNFGIPSVHGLMNGIYFFLTGGTALIHFIDRTKQSKWMLILLLVWPVLMLGRGILLTALVQIMVIYLFVNGFTAKGVMKLIFFVVLTSIGFGVIGDIRGAENPFQYLISEQYRPIFELLPTGFLWVYIYITSPLSNYAFNADTLIPTGNFGYSSVNLFPSLLRPEALDRADNFEFVDSALNVSTIFASSHSDFGYVGDALLLLLLMVWIFYWYYKLRSNSLYILPYAMVCTVAIFSIFYNLFLLYPYLFATVLQGYIASRSDRYSEGNDDKCLTMGSLVGMSDADNGSNLSREIQMKEQSVFNELVGQNRRLLILGSFVGVAVGFVLSIALPSEWEAKALIRVGQMGGSGSGNWVEPPQLVIDRLKSKSFQNDALKKLGLAANENDSKVESFRDSLKFKLEKSELINASLRGATADEAKLQMTAVIEQLKLVHAEKFSPVVSRWQKELATIQIDLKKEHEESDRLIKLLNARGGATGGSSVPQAVLLSNNLMLRDREIQKMQEDRRLLEEKLSAHSTFETDVLGEVEILDRPIFPKKSIFTVLGLVFGLLISFGWALWGRKGVALR